MTDLSSSVFRGLKWTSGAAFVEGAVQLGYSAVIARLLEPSAFGLLAMALAVLRFGVYFGQMGVGSALIQKQHLTEGNVRAAFTSSALLGATFFGVFWIAAPMIGRIYGSTELVPIVRALAATFILNNLAVTAKSLLRRELKFRVLSIIGIATYVIGYCVTGLAMAFAGLGVWSLVGATVVQSLLSAIAINGVRRHSFLPTLRRKHLVPLYSFGSRVSIVSFLEFLSSSLDTLLIGAILGARQLGFYNRGQMLVNLPLQLFSSSLSKVLFPALSRVQQDHDRLRRGYLMSVGIAGSVLLAVGFGMSVAAPEIVSALLGPGWEEAVPVLGILALAAPIHLLTHFGGVLLEATGKLNVKVVVQIMHLALLALLYVLFLRWGIIGFASALLIGAVARNIAYTTIISRQLELLPRLVFGAYLSALGSGFLAAIAIYIASYALSNLGAPTIIVLMGEISAGGIALAAALVFGPQSSVLRPMLGRLFPKRNG